MNTNCNNSIPYKRKHCHLSIRRKSGKTFVWYLKTGHGYVNKIRYCLLCNVRLPAQNTNSCYNKKRVKDVEKHTTHSNT